MKTLLSTWWDRLTTSYWFLPTIMAVAAIGLSAATLHIDGNISPKWARNPAWIWAGGPEGARNVLETIASSTITVAGVVFSITIVTLTLASSQFGPRLLRNFMSDRGTQLVLGVFVATFLYCLLVLRAIRGIEAVTVVPFLSVTCGILLGVTSVGFLIFFIHHISASIIAENVVGRVADEMQRELDTLYPEEAGQPASEEEEKEEIPEEFAGETGAVCSDRSGYIQAIGMESLLEIARQADLIIRLRRRPGDFLADGALLAEVVPKKNLDDHLAGKIRDTVFFGRHRTPGQDVEYSIDQLVEVAVRAMSPGINDPFTAMTCVEWLGAGLIQVAGRKIASRWRYDDDRQLRIITDATNFEGIARAALTQIRQYGASSVAVTVRLLEVLGRVGPHLHRDHDREVLLEHARLIRDDGTEAAVSESDRQTIRERYEATSKALSDGEDRLSSSD